MVRVKRNSGFSLVELSIAMVLLGLFVATSLQTYRIYIQRYAVYKTIGLSEPVRVALKRYYVLNNRYPCPADPALPETDPNAGLSVFDAVAGCEYTASPIAAGSCGGPGGGLCRALGREANPGTGGDGQDSVVIGAVHYATIGISPKETYDGWGMQLAYAVTNNLATTALADESLGTITVNNKPDASIPDDAHPFIVWSYGSSRRGAYTPQGRQRVACAPMNQGQDNENCDNDSTFLWDVYPGSQIRSLARGPNFYDSYMLLFRKDLTNDFWDYAPASPDKILNKAGGRVGIGINRPSEALDVAGNIRTPRAIAGRFCDENGQNCFTADTIGGWGQTTCGDPVNEPQAISGIQNNRAACPAYIQGGTIPSRICPIGQMAGGVDTTTGDLICVPIP